MSSTERGPWGQFRRTRDVSASCLHWRLPSSSANPKDLALSLTGSPESFVKLQRECGWCFSPWVDPALNRPLVQDVTPPLSWDSCDGRRPPTLSPGSAWSQKCLKGLAWWRRFALSVMRSHVFTLTKLIRKKRWIKTCHHPSEDVICQPV